MMERRYDRKLGIYANRWFSASINCRGDAMRRPLCKNSATAILVALALVAAVPQKSFAGHSIAQAANSSDTADSDKLKASELTAVLKASTSDSKFSGIKVVGTGPDVSILVHGDSKASDQNQKIDAIFLAKTLMEAVPTQVNKVKVLFVGTGSEESEFIDISKKELDDYGSGKISASTFLNSLHLLTVKPEEQPKVGPGPQSERRLLVWSRMEKLKSSGTGVTAFEKLFGEAETAAKDNDASLSDKLSFIESKLTEQEEQVRLAKKTASGRGITGVQGSSKTSTTSSAPGGPLPAALEQLRNEFLTHAPGEIQKVRASNPDMANKMEVLRSKVEQRKPAEAIDFMREFGKMVKSQSGYDPIEGKADAISNNKDGGGKPNFGGANGGNQGGPFGNRPNNQEGPFRGQFKQKMDQRFGNPNAWGIPK